MFTQPVHNTRRKYTVANVIGNGYRILFLLLLLLLLLGRGREGGEVV